MIENNWKEFCIDTNVAFGQIVTKENWEAIISSVASQPGFLGLNHAKAYLLTTKKRDDFDYPFFSFAPSACGETLAEFLGDLA